MIEVIQKLGGWIRGMTSGARGCQRVQSQSLSVERLEPRQLFAADCLFVMDVASPQVEDEPVYGDFSSEWRETDESVDARKSAPQAQISGDAPELLAEYEDYREIYLDNLIEDIGELFEVQDISLGNADAFDADEDWGAPWIA